MSSSHSRASSRAGDGHRRATRKSDVREEEGHLKAYATNGNNGISGKIGITGKIGINGINSNFTRVD